MVYIEVKAREIAKTIGLEPSARKIGVDSSVCLLDSDSLLANKIILY